MRIKELIENPVSDIQVKFNEWFKNAKSEGLKDIHLSLSNEEADLDLILEDFLNAINSPNTKPFVDY